MVEEEPPFLRGSGRSGADLSPVKIVKVSKVLSWEGEETRGWTLRTTHGLSFIICIRQIKYALSVFVFV